jgi:hypothetical protein
MNPRTRLSSEQKQQSETIHQSGQSSAREFGSAEELLRHDAAHTPVPPRVAVRLEQSLESVPRPRAPWWRRLFGS